MLIRPLRKKAPKIQELSCATESPPRAPTARMIATGAVAAKIQPMKPLAAWTGAKSAASRRRLGSGSVGRSR